MLPRCKISAKGKRKEYANRLMQLVNFIASCLALKSIGKIVFRFFDISAKIWIAESEKNVSRVKRNAVFDSAVPIRVVENLSATNKLVTSGRKILGSFWRESNSEEYCWLVEESGETLAERLQNTCAGFAEHSTCLEENTRRKLVECWQKRRNCFES